MVGIVGLCGSFKVAHGPGSVVCVWAGTSGVGIVNHVGLKMLCL